jgi:hypothetical protein
LLVENLDRLSREVAGEAVELFLSIVNRGVVVVQLAPAVLEFRRPVDTMQLMFAIVELSRGHSESAMKSTRSTANWEAALRLARDEGRPMTGRLPGWVEVAEGGAMALVPERAAVVRSIFAKATAGYGLTSIIKQLTAGGVPAFGDRVPDEDGHHRRADGRRYGCGEWRTAYVRSILRDRRALGEFQPRDQHDKPKGEPIAGYYPPVVTEAEFYVARAKVDGRRNRPGRIGEGVANLFGGLLRNARPEGGSYYCAVRSDNGVMSRVLLNSSSVEGKSRAFTFPYKVFERAVLGELRELDPAEVLGRREGTADPAAAVEGELGWVRSRKEELRAVLLKSDITVIAEELAKLEAREAELAGALDEAKQEAARPLADTWAEAKDLIGLLDAAEPGEREDLRLRLRAHVRRLVAEAWLLVVPRGRLRLCAVQLFFSRTDGAPHTFRSYLVALRGGTGNQNGRTPARWCVLSQRQPVLPDDATDVWGDLDLRTEAATVAAGLEAYPQDVIDRLLAEHGQDA